MLLRGGDGALVGLTTAERFSSSPTILYKRLGFNFPTLPLQVEKGHLRRLVEREGRERQRMGDCGMIALQNSILDKITTSLWPRPHRGSRIAQAESLD